MPSFLSHQQQHSSQVYNQNAGILHLDPDSQYGLAHGKVNGNPLQNHSSNNSNDSFDEASSSSSASNTTESSASASRACLNGGGSAGTTMTSSTTMMNGNATKDGLMPVPADFLRKPLPNGILTTTLVDRTVPRSHQQQPLREQHGQFPQDHNHQSQKRWSNGTRDGDVSPASSPADAHPRASIASTITESVQPSPVDLQTRSVNKGNIAAVDTGSLASLSVPVNVSQSVIPPHPTSPPPATPTSDVAQRNQNTPHRFSSPPHYSPAGATPSSSSAALAPPGHALKQRHTLEVPKVGPPRSSRDGADAFASGRFSPTASTPVGGRRGSLSLVRRNTRSLHSDLPRDGAIPDDDALRWAEAYRQKRASKRKRLEVEDDDRVLVGTKVDESHANWVAAYNMLTGIRVSVSRTNAKLDRPLTPDDFDAKQKSTFDIAGNELVPSAKYDFKFKDYAPWVFRHLRALFGLDPADYLMSLTGKYILSELGSPGKSGSFFYFSRDYKYIIKTIHHAEHKFLRKILKDYYEHAKKNPNTLLSQFYGLHRVKVPYGRKIHFVVMNNLFPPHRDIHQTFDLKGSTVGRDYKEDDLEKNPRATLKDLNWMRRQRHLELGIQKKQLFLTQLREDVKLLQRLKIMDYSLLIGIHDLQRGNEENLRQKTLQVFNPGGNAPPEDYDPQSVLMRTPSKLESQRKARELRQMLKAERPMPMGEGDSTMPDELEQGQTKSDSMFYRDDGGFQATHEDNAPGEEIYYLGVIDCLTHYGIIKKIEHFWKGLSNDRTQISALPPEEYGERFFSFMSGITMSSEEAQREAQERDAGLQAATAATEAAAQKQEGGKGKDRVSSWSDSLRRRPVATAIPPAPTHQPPPIPMQPSSSFSHRSPETDAVLRNAEKEAFKKPEQEENVPDRVLRTTALAGGSSSSSAGNNTKMNGPTSTASDRRDALQGPPILPVVEEAAEASSTGGHSRSRSRISDRSGPPTDNSSERPLTPAKDGARSEAGFGLMSYSGSNGKGTAANRPGGGGHPPPTPPKSSGNHLLKPESADSGYGVVGSGRTRSGSGSESLKTGIKVQINRDSLDKALPPLPKNEIHFSESTAAMERY